MIRFNVIRWMNFMATGNEFTELRLDATPTTLIVGVNGSGKSTLLDALAFALFGRPYRSVPKNLLVNTITREGLLVEVEFTIGQAKYLVRRGIKPNLFEVYKNGTLLNQDADSRDYQKVLEKQILRVNFKSFCQVVILGSANYVQFMALPAGNRRALVEDLLDLQMFSVMNILLKQKVSDNARRIEENEKDQRTVREKIDFIADHTIAAEERNEKVVLEKRDRIESIEHQCADALARELELAKRAEELRKDLAALDPTRKRDQAINKLKIQLAGRLELLRRERKFFEDNHVCPTCSQSLEPQFRCEMIEKKQSKLEEVESGFAQLEQEYDRTHRELERLLETSRTVADIGNQRVQITHQVAGWREYQQQLKDEVARLTSDCSVAVDDGRMQELDAQLSSLVARFNELGHERILYQVAAAMLKDGGIKGRIISQYVPVINGFINKYLAMMDFFVNFELDENFDERIMSRYRDEFVYNLFSEGEKFRINLAILFTWRDIARLRNSVSTNLLIMDETLDGSLDVAGTESFFKVLNEIGGDTNAFIISHKVDQMIDKFPDIIKFEKTKNFSKMVTL